MRRPGAVPDDNGPRIECLEFVDGGEPVEAPLRVGLDEVWMRTVVDGVACDGELDRPHVKTRGVICVRVADVHHEDLVSFELELVTFESLGSKQRGGNQAREHPAAITSCPSA